MLLPIGDPIWVKLRTSFINIDPLLLFLKQEQLTGYAYFVFPNEEGVVFFQDGDAFSGLEAVEAERKAGQEAVNGLLTRSRQNKEGLITVSRLPRETVEIFSHVYRFSVKLRFKDLSSEFSSFSPLISKLENERFTGYIEIKFPEEKEQGVILLENGIIKALLTDEIHMILKRDDMADLNIIKSKVEAVAQRQGAIFDVFDLHPAK